MDHNTERELLTPAEVARLFRVDPKTVTRWAKTGKLTSIKTLGGHRRYRATEVHALLNPPADGTPAPEAGREYPHVIPCREQLTGRTMTVERLPGDAVTAYGASSASHVGRLAVVERIDGKFVVLRCVATAADSDTDMEDLAAAFANSTEGAVHVDPWTGAAR